MKSHKKMIIYCESLFQSELLEINSATYILAIIFTRFYALR